MVWVVFKKRKMCYKLEKYRYQSATLFTLLQSHKFVVFPITLKNPTVSHVSKSALTIPLAPLHRTLIGLTVTIVYLTFTICCLLFEFSSEIEALTIFQSALTISQAFWKMALIDGSIGPVVDTLAISQTLYVLSLVSISVWERLFAKTVFEEVLESSLIFLAVKWFMNSFTFYNPFFPFTHIAITFGRCPHTHTVSLPFSPLSRIKLAIRPSELSFALLFIVFEHPIILSILRYLHSFKFVSFLPRTFKNTSIFYFYTDSFPLLWIDFANEEWILSILYRKKWALDELNHLDIWVLGNILLNKSWQITLCWNSSLYLLHYRVVERLLGDHVYLVLCFAYCFSKVGFHLERILFFPLSFFALHFLMHIVLHGFFLQRVFLLALNGVKIFSISYGFEGSLVNSVGLVSGVLFLYFDFQLVFV